MVTPLPEQTRPEPMITPVYNPPVGLTEGFDIHRPSIEDLVMYKKGAGAGEKYIPTYKNGTYVAAKYHVHQRPDKSPAPVNGQKSLDNAIPVIDKKGVKTEGVLVSVNNDGGIVIFRNKSDKPGLPEYHGYVTDYKEILTRHNDIKQALEIKGCFTEKGKFIKGTE